MPCALDLGTDRGREARLYKSGLTKAGLQKRVNKSGLKNVLITQAV